MPRDAVAWLCVVGDRGVSWNYFAPDPEHYHPDKVPGKLGKLEPLVVDQGELRDPRQGHQN